MSLLRSQPYRSDPPREPRSTGSASTFATVVVNGTPSTSTGSGTSCVTPCSPRRSTAYSPSVGQKPGLSPRAPRPQRGSRLGRTAAVNAIQRCQQLNTRQDRAAQFSPADRATDLGWLRRHAISTPARRWPTSSPSGPETLGEPYARHLGGKTRELRFHLDRSAVRLSYWLAPGARVVLLTVFRKTRQVERAEVARAIAAQQTCETGHDATHLRNRPSIARLQGPYLIC